MKKLFVGNLDFGATEESIRSAFEAYGAVERVSLMTDRDTGRSRSRSGDCWFERHQPRWPCDQRQ
jgi:RNA recognition motif-containing protein